MPLYEITVSNMETTGNFSSTVFLDGAMYRFVFYTNKWDNTIYFDLFDNNNLPLIRAAGLVAGIDLLFPYRYLPVPPGTLFCYSQGTTTQQGTFNTSSKGVATLIDPSLDAFSKDVATLYYLSVT